MHMNTLFQSLYTMHIYQQINISFYLTNTSYEHDKERVHSHLHTASLTVINENT